MNKHFLKNITNKGEASIVFTFVILTIVIMSAFTISVISISTIKGAKTGESSALALNAADTGLERGMFEYWWAGGDASAGACSSNDQTYQETILGLANPYSYYMVVDDKGDSQGECPTIAQLNDSDQNNSKMLCIEAIGEYGGTQRKLSNSSGKDGGADCEYK